MSAGVTHRIIILFLLHPAPNIFFFCRTKLIWLIFCCFCTKAKQGFLTSPLYVPSGSESEWTEIGRRIILSHTSYPKSTNPHCHKYVLSYFLCVSLPTDSSCQKDCYVNAVLNRSEWTGLKQIMLNCLLV